MAAFWEKTKKTFPNSFQNVLNGFGIGFFVAETLTLMKNEIGVQWRRGACPAALQSDGPGRGAVGRIFC